MDELRTILEYFSQNPPPWVDHSPSTSKKKKLDNDIQIVEDVLRSLTLAAEHFRNIWNWSEFLNIYLKHNDTYVVWLACQCMAIILQLTESEKLTLINHYMDQKHNIRHMIKYNSKSNLNPNNLYISNNYIMVEEVPLPIVGSPKQDNDLILVNSTKDNLRNLSLAVKMGKVACLVGPVGSGKTALVYYLANITGHTDDKLITVQLGDETDSKMMLGSYHCTDIPGEFVWQPGALTKAVTEGKWLLLEDIDSASSDLAAVLVSLIESRSLTVPGFRDRIIPATGFQLFLTQRIITTTSGYYHKQNTATDLLGKHYIQINIEPLSKSELIEVIKLKFPILTTIAPKIIDVFMLFSAGFHNNEVILNLKCNGRLISTRDLMKWCGRIVIEYDVTSSESAIKVIQDAIDIFCCSAGNSKTRLELAYHVASLIGVVKTKAEFFLNEHKPTIVLDEKHCIAGRVTLPRSGSFLTNNYISISKFALTRSSSCLLERVACSIVSQESVLLVGETGTGKTSTLQLLAKHTGNKLIVLNMNQQSDCVDLIGGYKPVDLKVIVQPIREEFENLFRLSFNVENNNTFLMHLSICFNNREWLKLIQLMNSVIKVANDKLKSKKSHELWEQFNKKLIRFELQFQHSKSTMAFAFVEGSLIKAVKEGYWVLLDEINLATAETLQCLSSLLESDGTMTIYEKNDSKPIPRHSNFRLMAAMNPATDVGKKDLPPGIRNRFTEFFVDELTERSDLITLTACYLSDYSAEKLNAISKFYLIVKREAEKCLVDGTGHKPHYSLRTYCRALSIASSNPCQSAQRSLYESFCLSFLTQLDSSSHKRVEFLIASTIFGEKLIQGIINQPIPTPITKTQSYIQFEGYWIQKGDLEPCTAKKYILTTSVKKNLCDLVRAVSLSSFPVLIQGDTCVGKTSLITYLAAASGNNLVRINNHEHTDLQEYIGSYSAQSITGQLVFKEGVLVEAMRKGHWIVLDELNLAPTDVLEALNRVLDDNRELFIPETQTVVKAHPGFRLFATQNPPGLYGGRKILSRAFKNRFIEMHFDEIPPNELETILFQRCEMPLSYAKKVVSVMKELQSIRKGSAAFAGKHGYITLRDLFRWGERYRLADASDNYNWNQHLVDEGFLVLASKVRKPEEEQTIMHILKKHFNCSINLDRLFTLNNETSPITRHILEKIQNQPTGFEHVFMSKNIRRMVVLSCKAIEFNEPVLLVGETGCGKTTVCQMIATISEKKLLTVNCHQHTESSDFLGGLRPVRNRNLENKNTLFEWIDGPLVEALTGGHMFLADEISLADDSVLERFNSLLEPERKILLSEKISDNDSESEIIAHPKFCFVGTMNPGGDYGKKELSPALRNRLTEIWCESCSDHDDLVRIINHNFSILHDYSLSLSKAMVYFVNWVKTSTYTKNYLNLNISIRDYLVWVNFIESMMNQLSKNDANYNSLLACVTFYVEGATMIFLDNKTTISPYNDKMIRIALVNSLKEYCPSSLDYSDSVGNALINVFPKKCTSNWFGYDGYYIPRGNIPEQVVSEFSFDTLTTKQNTIRLLRCMQIEDRAILLEGSPGVGKTSLIQAVSKASGHTLTRINLSEQTDVSDLFGADLPTDGGDSGSFEWRDGPFLRALKEGSWILLDELNLASQSVLEGLNAVLDHRGELYIPELGRKFIIESKQTRLFACQNPMNEGGARKGLPKSFLNRFLRVHLNILDCKNIVDIVKSINKSKPNIIKSLNLEKVVNFTMDYSNNYLIDINLRDILRWVDVTIKLKCKIVDHLPLMLTDRNIYVKNNEYELFEKMNTLLNTNCKRYNFLKVFPSAIMFNKIIIKRKRPISMPIDQNNSQLILRSHIHTLNSLAVCMNMNWMPILVGSGCGKTSVIKTLAQLCGHELRVLSVNSAMDTIEILGGFEQADFNRHLEEFAKKIENVLYLSIGEQLLNDRDNYISLLTLWNEYKTMTDVTNINVPTMSSETTLFKQRISTLIQITNALQNVELSNSLQILSERVNINGNLNSCGKFEWIDSILVKCLKNGCWLLIDNVNLCSAAVLDRLNGLLEPNGVLEIGEKGIDPTGRITTIKPHKDFRLFLAMDPKHGNISKAMKNRGVEIYMTPLEEIDTDDMYSLLKLQGIDDNTIIQTLIKVHTTMKYLVTGVTFTINHLLRTAYLISQNITSNKSIIQIVREICIDTYVYYLNGEMKMTALLEIDKILDEHTNTSDHIWFPNPQTRDILQHSNLCYIKHYFNIIEQYEHFRNTTLKDLLLCYFGRSSSSDFEFRSQWLELNFNCDFEPINNFIQLTQSLKFDNYNFITKNIKSIDSKDLPYDYRYIPKNYIKKANSYSVKTLAENKMHLILDFNLNQCLDLDKTIFVKTKKTMMLGIDGFSNDFIILSIAFDDFVNFFINEQSLTIHSLGCLEFKEIIISTRRIEKLIFDDDIPLKDEFLNVLIYCYFKIVVKRFVPLMKPLAEGFRDSKWTYLSNISDDILKKFLTHRFYTKLLKCFKQQIKIPLYQCCKNHGDRNIELYRQNNELITAVESSNNVEVIMTSEIKNQRNNLLNFDFINCKSVTNFSGDNLELKMNDTELNLIPLWELVIERNLLKIINCSLNNVNIYKSQPQIKKYLTFVKTLLHFVPTVSPLYCNSLKRLNAELQIEALKHSMNSVALQHPELYLKCTFNNIAPLQNDSDIIDMDMVYSFEQPLFTVFITNILLKKAEPYYIFAPRPIRLIDNNSRNLLCIKSFIWNNKWFSDNQFEYVYSLIKLVNVSFSSLLPNGISSLEQLYLLRNNISCVKSVASKIEHDQKMFKAIFYTADEVACIQRNVNLYVHKKYNTNFERHTLLNQINLSAGRLWILTGICSLEVLSAIQPIDSLKKAKVKNECDQAIKTKLKHRLNAERLFCKADCVSEIFPFAKYYNKQFEILNSKNNKSGYRPHSPLYTVILKEITRFTEMYGLKSSTYSIIDPKRTDYIVIVDDLSNWLSSVSNFYNSLDKHYAAYPDVLSGILLSINQMRYGARLLLHHYKCLICEDKHTHILEEELTLFGEFPRFCPNIIDMTNKDIVVSMTTNDRFKWYKVCLEELNNMLYMSGQSCRIDQYVSSIQYVMEKFFSNWERLQKEKEHKKHEEDSLYKQKSMCETISIDIEIAQGVAHQFPNTKCSDFSDIEVLQSLDSDIDQVSVTEEIYSLTEKDISDICRLHTELVRPVAIGHWLSVFPEQYNKEETMYRFKNAFSDRFCLFGKLLLSKFQFLNKSMDSTMLPWLIMATEIAINPNTNEMAGYYNFYRDSNVINAKKTYQVLKTVEDKIQVLLNEWPDHPTLQTIMKVIVRIMNFDWTSPTCRFLIGLELLLTKLHEWEEVAHQGVSVRELSLILTHCIQEYRTLELSTWKDCLKASHKKVENDSSIWWFHLYSIFKAYLNKQVVFEHLVTTLQKFMESSSLGQYTARLELLYTFHCDVVCREKSKEQTELCNASWNLYKYYYQFKECIHLHIETLSKDIKKKFQDFIKIVKWNDINYWSIKETVTKVQQTLHKYTREYEEILNNPASVAMTTQSPIIINKSDSYVLPILKFNYYLQKCEIILYIESSKTLNVLTNLNKYSKKVFTFSDIIMTKCTYSASITELNDFINGVMESAQELRTLNVDPEAPKNKQKSQAKQILQQKRKALSELFKALQRIGLSFKAGLIGCEQMNCSIEFARLPPLDINAALDFLTPKIEDKDLRHAWSDCESYFLKSVSQTTALKVASDTPKLGQQEMDRIKGFINDIKNMTWNTKKILSTQIDSLIKFRSLTYLSDIITKSNCIIFDPSDEFKKPIDYVINSINVLQQFKVALNSCRENMDNTSNTSVTCLIRHVFDKSNENSDEIIDNLDSVINLAQNKLNILKDKKKYHAMKLCDIDFIEGKDYWETIELCNKLRDYINELYEKVLISTNNTLDKYNFEPQSLITVPKEPALKEMNSLINHVLKSVEKLYKIHSNIQPENETDKLIKSQILQPLSADLKECDLTFINEQLKSILKFSIGNDELRSCIPLFEQYALLVQYFITQQTMAYRVLSKMNYLLSTLFTDLTLNGFCIPDEFLEGEDGIQSDGKSGMGLTEGEGAKDVSDQIESQDQLEDAKKNYDNEPEQDKDLKEEEKGVEMSDDFDGKLHDVDNNENENSDGENDDDNQDKEMGETGDGADTLDEKLWGSDSDSENGDEQENQDLKEEDGKGGESMGEKQLGAKSDAENNKQQNDKENVDSNNKKDINELNEDGEEADEDHANPHHGDLQPPPESEPLDLPNDLQLDQGELNDNEEGEENPFDIDAMKENMDINEKDDDISNENTKEDTNNLEDTSDEENDNGNKIDDIKDDNDELEDEKNNENNKDDDGGKKDENKTGEDPKEEYLKQDTDIAKPSEDEPSQVEVQPSNLDNGGSKDQVCENIDGQDHNGDIENNKEEATGPEQQGIGQSQKESKETKQGHNIDEDKGAQSSEPGTKDKKRRMKPGEKDTDRTLSDSNVPMKKRLKTTNISDHNKEEIDDVHENKDSNNEKGELFKHVKESKKGDTETLDAATNEQLEKRPIPNNEDEKCDELKGEEMELEDDRLEDTFNIEEILPEKMKPIKQNNQPSLKESDNFENDENLDLEHIDVDGEVVLTQTAERGMETMFHTTDVKDSNIYPSDKKDHKEYIKNQLNKWFECNYKNIPNDKAWNKCMDITYSLAQELSEQLRLVLEPSKASRLQGDFRTGRRINMRRVIPYIASQFKKDKIWLRRTKPSKRQYQIIMAVDNSSSMSDSHAKYLAFESLALVSKALTLVEAGELGVMSFGEKSRIVHPLGESFVDETGIRLMHDFTFDEQQTKVGELIELATAVFEERGRLDTGDRPAQLLVIMSDGRGIESEGQDIVKNAIRIAKLIGIFIVFIVIDNPISKESILDIKMPIFENNSVRIESYMDNFPFPFYIILKDLDKLPGVLSDALREWFELVTN